MAPDNQYYIERNRSATWERRHLRLFGLAVIVVGVTLLITSFFRLQGVYE